MTRVATTNYAGSPTTTFQWATAGGDLFSRENDLYKLAQALEGHDHSAGKGVAVQRVAAGAIGTDELEDSGVTTDKINDDAVTRAKIGPQAVGADEIEAGSINAGHLATDSVGADEIVTGGVGTAEIANLAVTNGKMAVGAALANLGYTPFNSAGGVITDKVTISGSFGGYSLEAAGSILTSSTYDAKNNFGYRIQTLDGTNRYVTRVNTINELEYGNANFGITRIVGFQFNTLKYNYGSGSGSGVDYNIWHSGIDGAGSGLDADLLDGQDSAYYATAASVAALSSGGAVPSGLIAAFATAAAIASGWNRLDGNGGRPNFNGRMLVGAGTTFTTTFAETVAYGSSWSFTPTASAGGIGLPVSGMDLTVNLTHGGGDHVAGQHTHNGPTVTVNPVTWVIPSVAVVWAQKS